MSAYDFQADLANLRREIQTDRLATNTMMNEGFNRLYDKLEEVSGKFDVHVNEDTRRFAEVGERITHVETASNAVASRQKLVAGGIWTIVITLLGAAASWAFGG